MMSLTIISFQFNQLTKKLSSNPKLCEWLKKSYSFYYYYCSFSLLLGIVREEIVSTVLVPHKTIMMEGVKEKWRGEAVYVFEP